jgi:ElaB/YqjD/DUF883 family membrane-anchored ribosome-binding protein
MSDTTADNSNGNGAHDHLDSSREHVRAAASEARDAAAEAAREFREKATAFAGEWKERAAGVQKEMEDYVRKNPTKSVLAAVGVGFVIGLICRR